MAIEKSILQRLKNKSRKERIAFQLVLQLFCQEEFLRRLAISKYSENFILKGGLFLFAYCEFKSRPTMDIDFLIKNLSNDQEKIINVIEEIVSEESGNDYIDFHIKSIENISEQKEYHGVRIKMVASILNTKTPFDIDIGVGDVIVPKAESRSLGTQLSDFESPRILTYSLESSIAEKWEAMISRMEASSRMKDYYDIYYLACHYDFDGKILRNAIEMTLNNRKTFYDDSSLERIANMDSNQEMKRRWNTFVKKSLGIDLAFHDVISIVIQIVEGPMRAIAKEEPFSEKWSCKERIYL